MIKPLNNLTLLIFDIDGVLVDVSQSYRKAIKQTVEFFYQKEINADEIQQLKNETGYNNDWDLTQELLKRKGVLPEKNKIVDHFQSIYWNHGHGLILNETWLLDKNILNQLSHRYQLAIFTGRPGLEAKFVLHHNEVYGYFNPIIAMEDVVNGKPNPEGIHKILNALQVDPEQACYFGDTLDDIRSAIRGGIHPVGVLPPPHKEELIPLFKKENALLVLKTINDLGELLLPII